MKILKLILIGIFTIASIACGKRVSDRRVCSKLKPAILSIKTKLASTKFKKSKKFKFSFNKKKNGKYQVKFWDSTKRYGNQTFFNKTYSDLPLLYTDLALKAESINDDGLGADLDKLVKALRSDFFKNENVNQKKESEYFTEAVSNNVTNKTFLDSRYHASSKLFIITLKDAKGKVVFSNRGFFTYKEFSEAVIQETSSRKDHGTFEYLYSLSIEESLVQNKNKATLNENKATLTKIQKDIKTINRDLNEICSKRKSHRNNLFLTKTDNYLKTIKKGGVLKFMIILTETNISKFGFAVTCNYLKWENKNDINTNIIETYFSALKKKLNKNNKSKKRLKNKINSNMVPLPSTDNLVSSDEETTETESLLTVTTVKKSKFSNNSPTDIQILDTQEDHESVDDVKNVQVEEIPTTVSIDNNRTNVQTITENEDINDNPNIEKESIHRDTAIAALNTLLNERKKKLARKKNELEEQELDNVSKIVVVKHNANTIKEDINEAPAETDSESPKPAPSTPVLNTKEAYSKGKVKKFFSDLYSKIKYSSISNVTNSKELKTSLMLKHKENLNNPNIFRLDDSVNSYVWKGPFSKTEIADIDWQHTAEVNSNTIQNGNITYTLKDSVKSLKLTSSENGIVRTLKKVNPRWFVKSYRNRKIKKATQKLEKIRKKKEEKLVKEKKEKERKRQKQLKLHFEELLNDTNRDNFALLFKAIQTCAYGVAGIKININATRDEITLTGRGFKNYKIPIKGPLNYKTLYKKLIGIDTGLGFTKNSRMKKLTRLFFIRNFEPILIKPKFSGGKPTLSIKCYKTVIRIQELDDVVKLVTDTSDHMSLKTNKIHANLQTERTNNEVYIYLENKYSSSASPEKQAPKIVRSYLKQINKTTHCWVQNIEDATPFKTRTQASNMLYNFQTCENELIKSMLSKTKKSNYLNIIENTQEKSIMLKDKQSFKYINLTDMTYHSDEYTVTDSITLKVFFDNYEIREIKV